MTGELPQDLAIHREFIMADAGICPSRGVPCERLGDLRLDREVSGQSFAMGFGDGDFSSMTHGQREAYERKLEEDLARGELLSKAAAGSCLEACVLEDTGEVQ